MDTGTAQGKITTAFINDKNPLLDIIYQDLIASGVDVLFRSEDVEDGLSKLSALKQPLQVCIIDVDFESKKVLKQLHKLKSKYPNTKLIAHSDIDTEETISTLSSIGFDSYLLLGSDIYDFRRAIERA